MAIKEHYKVNIKIYWVDYFLSSLAFLICLTVFYYTASIISLILGAVFGYRAGAFIHEISHQNKNPSIKWFKRVWNLTGGLLMIQPSVRFTRPHIKHHTTGIFATKDDPQYPLIFSKPLLAFTIFGLLPFLLPIYNFLICLVPIKHNKLEDVLYKNIKFTSGEYKEAYSYGFYYVLVYILLLILQPKLLLALYTVSTGAWFLSVLRIPLEHDLTQYKETSVYEDQKLDSFTHESPIFIPIQPLALRFHTAHHMYPRIPYHNLKKFHKETIVPLTKTL